MIEILMVTYTDLVSPHLAVRKDGQIYVLAMTKHPLWLHLELADKVHMSHPYVATPLNRCYKNVSGYGTLGKSAGISLSVRQVINCIKRHEFMIGDPLAQKDGHIWIPMSRFAPPVEEAMVRVFQNRPHLRFGRAWQAPNQAVYNKRVLCAK